MFNALVVLWDGKRRLQHAALIIATYCNSKKQAALDCRGHFFLACLFQLCSTNTHRAAVLCFFFSLFPNMPVVIENSNRLPKSFHCRQLPWNVLTTNCFKLHFFSFFFSVGTAWTSIPLSWLWCGVPVFVSVKVTITLEQDAPLVENLTHQTLFFLMPDFSGAVSHV